MPSDLISAAEQALGAAAPVSVEDAIRVLSEHYGPFDDEPRLDPAHEVVLTILSQHTSDTKLDPGLPAVDGALWRPRGSSRGRYRRHRNSHCPRAAWPE